MSSPFDLYETILRDGRPSSLLECMLEDGSVDTEKYMTYLQKQNDLHDVERNMIVRTTTKDSSSYTIKTKSSVPSKRRKRRCKSLRPYYFDDDGNMVHLKPTQTVWYAMYVTAPRLDCPSFNRKFRRRFRLPYNEYLGLLERVKLEYDIFGQWQRKDAVGNPPSPIQLLLLGSLRYLGRGLTFDDLEEYTAVGEETHRQFFHLFIRYGSSRLHPVMVKYPKTKEEYAIHQAEFDKAGLTGAAFSTDATNVIMWRCSYNLKQSNTGFKQSNPARTYNLTVNHRREILHSTEGHPSRWNDKTLAHVDEFMVGLHEGKILQDVIFCLLSRAEDGSITSTKYKGGWGLVDNGYHKWACIQAPAKSHMYERERRLSQWIESMRKDVECTFGILKGRWRVLKTGIRVAGDKADEIWLTCCALHNLLLFADGLSKEWKRGVRSDWEGELGQNDSEDFRIHTPFAINRLNDTDIAGFGSEEHRRSSVREAELERRQSGLEEEQMQEEEDGNNPVTTADGAILVNSLSYDEFRKRLLENFDIRFKRRQVVWPQRNGPQNI